MIAPAAEHVHRRPHAPAALALVLVAALALAACGGSGSKTAGTGSATVSGAGTSPAAAAVPGADVARAEFAGIAQSGAVAGSPKAAWTLVEFGDLQCPACKFYANTTLPPVVEKLVRTGRIRFEMRPFGFVGPDSVPAAAYAWAAANQNRLHEFARLWYLNQGEENSGYVTDAFARRIAAGVPGLDPGRLVSDAKTLAVRGRAKQTAGEFQRRGLNGTPSFLIGRTGGKLTELNLGSGTGAEAVAAIEAAIS